MFDTIILTPQTSLSYKVLSSNSTKGYMQFKKKKEPMLQKYIRNEMFKNGAYNLRIHFEEFKSLGRGGGEKKKTGNI